ncbi:RloB domain-containing protein [Planomonospora parontospora]|uniref:RloB domain-containing protein n=1 Tax=Planomonospora parontospora TaxID=58119 RepID=UPI0019B2C642|nr:RloB domain-containing protein [Planomonospora parontospora]GGL44417.1 hypothetical protein GCM10014719_52200 [Planomonospora parontospora subsp. antibiotica]GII18617.1 hypothetical protein Ppa05_53430 [Planomonospora parontospora subsp. antibiotica]
MCEGNVTEVKYFVGIFEIWLLWHFQDCSATLSSAVVQGKVGRHLPGYDKHLPKDFPYERYETARRRAQNTDPAHVSANRKGGNPSTNVWLTVEAIAESGRTQREHR